MNIHYRQLKRPSNHVEILYWVFHIAAEHNLTDTRPLDSGSFVQFATNSSEDELPWLTSNGEVSEILDVLLPPNIESRQLLPQTTNCNIDFFGVRTASSFIKGEARLDWFPAVLRAPDGTICEGTVQYNVRADPVEPENQRYLAKKKSKTENENTPKNKSQKSEKKAMPVPVDATTSATGYTLTGLAPGVEYKLSLVATATVGGNNSRRRLEFVEGRDSHLWIAQESPTPAAGVVLHETFNATDPTANIHIAVEGSGISVSFEADDLPEKLFDIQDGSYVTGIDSLGIPFILKVYSKKDDLATKISFITRRASTDEVFSTYDGSFDTVLERNPLEVDGMESSRRSLTEVGFSAELVKVKVDLGELKPFLEGLDLDKYGSFFKPELTREVTTVVKFKMGKTKEKGVYYQGDLIFIDEISAGLKFGASLEKDWSFQLPKVPIKLPGLKAKIPIGWFPLIVELNPSVYSFAKAEFEGKLEAVALNYKIKSTLRVWVMYDKISGVKAGVTADLPASPTFEYSTPTIEAGASVKVGVVLNCEILIEYLTGFDVALESNLVKATIEGGISSADELAAIVPIRTRLRELEVARTMNIPIHFKVRKLFFGKSRDECKETCEEKQGEQRGDRLSKFNFDVCLDGCLSGWERVEIFNREISKIQITSLPEIEIKASGHIDKFKYDLPVAHCDTIQAFPATIKVTAEAVNKLSTLFPMKLEGPFAWYLDLQTGKEQWKHDNSKTSELTLKLQGDKCVRPVGKIYVEAKPSFKNLSPFWDYSIVGQIDIEKLFVLEESGKILSPPLPLPTSSSPCYPKDGIEGMCKPSASCTGSKSIALNGFCNEGGAVCCVEQPITCTEKYLGREGICKHAQYCPDVGSGKVVGQFLATGDDCPRGVNDKDIKCCLKGITCGERGSVGMCKHKSDCPNSSTQFRAGQLCPGGVDIQCCLNNIKCEYESVSGICREDSFCTSSTAITVKNLCPGSETVRCCFDKESLACKVEDGNRTGICRRENNCLRTASQLPANDTFACPADYKKTNVCCISDLTCSTDSGAKGVCKEAKTCTYTETQFGVTEGYCPSIHKGDGTVCCLDNISCIPSPQTAEGSEKQGVCRHEKFCSQNDETEVSFINSTCPTSPDIGCCASDVECKLEHPSAVGVCRSVLGDDVLSSAKWAVFREGVCPPADHVACHVEAQKHGFELVQSLRGDLDEDQFGLATDLSFDGSILVIGAPGANADDGYVDVYQYQKQDDQNEVQGEPIGEWVRKGERLPGGSGERFGAAVATNADGTVIVVGAPQSDGGKGRILVFWWNTDNWSIQGEVLFGRDVKEGFGTTVDINDEGTVIAVGAPFAGGVNNHGRTVNRGRVDIYNWDPTATRWITPDGSPILGELLGEMSGSSVSLSSSGLVLAVGSPLGIDFRSNLSTGNVRVFAVGGIPIWRQRGDAIPGWQAGSRFGATIHLDGSGDKVAVGSPEFNGGTLDQIGSTHVFQFRQDVNGEHYFDGDWVLMPDIITGEHAGDSMSKVTMDKTGSVIVIGSPWYGEGKNEGMGRSLVFTFIHDMWRMMPSSFDGTSIYDLSGIELAVSGNAMVVAVSKTEINNIGQVDVYVRKLPELPEEVQNTLITCIAVIDENSPNFDQTSVDNKWKELREKFPERRFCLLQPKSNYDILRIPTDFHGSDLNTFQVVNRDAANAANPSDWFEICGLPTEREKGMTRVGLYIDNSGSMYTSNVQASYDLFLQKTNEVGFYIVVGTQNAAEDMIGPCLSTTSQVFLLTNVMKYLDTLKYPYQRCAIDYFQSQIEVSVYEAFTCRFQDRTSNCGPNLDLEIASKLYTSDAPLSYQVAALNYLQSKMESTKRSGWEKFIRFWREVEVCI
jgi:hypothetical protein